MEDITAFSMKDCLSVPGQDWKLFNSLRNEEDEPIYTYNNKYMRWFVRQSFKGGKVCAVSQYYESKKCDDNLKIISEELNVKRIIHDIIEAYLKCKNKNFKIFDKEFGSKFKDHRDVEEEKSLSLKNQVKFLFIN